VVAANDAVTPCNKMGLLYKEEKWPGRASQGMQLWPIYDCTGCGRCTEYCVHGVPVAEKLFEARKEYKWDHAQDVAKHLTDEQDPVGDLAEELGDSESAQRRMQAYLRKQTHVLEPKSLFFLRQNKIHSTLSWEEVLSSQISQKLLSRLEGPRWLLHESVWLSRHLGRFEDLEKWIGAALSAGIKIQRPFARGKDCMDCGGEGIYSELFPAQADRIALEIWERDRHQADGVLCLSLRCAQHFRKVLGSQVPVISFSELFEGGVSE
jgi:ferredoxin